jgi:hypothetical protein
VEARRTSSQQRSSNSWDCRQHHTRNHTTSGGFARDEIFVSANSVDCHTTSNPSRMRYYVMFPHWMSVMFSWANHICGNAMLFMSLDPVVSLFTLGGHLYRIPEVVPTIVPPKQCRKVVSHTTKFIFFTICSKGEQKDTATTTASAQAPSIQQKQVDKIATKHKDSFCTQSSHVADWLKRFNPSNNRFVTTFHKPSSAMSPARQATHQDSDSTNASPSPPGTQRNGDHFFLRRED